MSVGESCFGFLRNCMWSSLQAAVVATGKTDDGGESSGLKQSDRLPKQCDVDEDSSGSDAEDKLTLKAFAEVRIVPSFCDACMGTV